MQDRVGRVVGNLEDGSKFIGATRQSSAKQVAGCVEQKPGLRNRAILLPTPEGM